jgi:hypothetical protein
MPQNIVGKGSVTIVPYQFTRTLIKLATVIIVDMTVIGFIQHFIQYPSSRLSSYVDETVGIMNGGFDMADDIRFFCIHEIL